MYPPDPENPDDKEKTAEDLPLGDSDDQKFNQVIRHFLTNRPPRAGKSGASKADRDDDGV
jgi:hypothetical protein